ncbi:MAG TPA: hypothetical protein VGN49_13055 [Micrococcaceae bacterium]|jgi:hypothetical protein|nr:hypothetical protein [Micrococcaceae bacterium]
MVPTDQPQDNRIDRDVSKGPNPTPGGGIDTGDSAVPPYEGRTTTGAGQGEGTARAMGSEPPAAEPTAPGSDQLQDSADMAPEGVGESIGPRGEDMADDDGKEAGRANEGDADHPTGRRAGVSDPRDQSGVDPQQGNTGRTT